MQSLQSQSPAVVCLSCVSLFCSGRLSHHCICREIESSIENLVNCTNTGFRCYVISRSGNILWSQSNVEGGTGSQGGNLFLEETKVGRALLREGLAEEHREKDYSNFCQRRFFTIGVSTKSLSGVSNPRLFSTQRHASVNGPVRRFFSFS